jgi:hypothetical protein
MPPPVPPPHPPIEPRQRHRVLPWIVGGFALLLVIGIAVSPRTDTPPASAIVGAPPASEQMAVPADAGFGDGTWIVGIHITPGTYRSPGAAPGIYSFCSWATRASRTGANGNSYVISRGFAKANANEPLVVEITEAVGAFQTYGCAPWRLIF